MGFHGANSSVDILIPKGIVIAYPIISSVVDVDAGIDLGYCQEATLAIEEERLEIKTARDNSRALIVDKSIGTDYTLPLELISSNPDNFALLFQGATSTLTQTGGSYDHAAADAITSSAVLDRAHQALTKRSASITLLKYDGGSAIHTAGATLTGGTSSATAEIVYVDGDATSGTLYLVTVAGGPFENNEVLTDDNGVPGTSVANGVITIKDDICLTDTAGTTLYVKGTDYGIDHKSGTLFYLSTGSITAVESIKAYYDYATLTDVNIQTGATGVEHYEMHILPFSDLTENNFEYIFWKCSVKAESEIKLITSGDEETKLEVILRPLTDGPNASSDEPIFRQRQVV